MLKKRFGLSKSVITNSIFSNYSYLKPISLGCVRKNSLAANLKVSLPSGACFIFWGYYNGHIIRHIEYRDAQGISHKNIIFDDQNHCVPREVQDELKKLLDHIELDPRKM